MADDTTNNPTNPTGAEPGQKTDAGEKTFTQTELNRLIDERLTRERAKYADYADLKKAADQWKAHEDAQKTELEKLQAQITDWQNRATQAEAARKHSVLRSSVMAEAAKQGVPADRIEAAYKLLNSAELKVEADDAIPNLSEAVARLLTDNPFLVAQAAPGKPPTPKTSPTNPASAPTGDSQWLAEYKANLRNPGGGQTFGKGGVKPPTEG